MSNRKFDKTLLLSHLVDYFTNKHKQLKSTCVAIDNQNFTFDNDPEINAYINEQTAPLKQLMKDIEYLLENAFQNCNNFIERLSVKDWQAYQASVRARKSRRIKSRSSVKRIEIRGDQHDKLSAIMKMHSLEKYEDALDYLLKHVEE